ncbi:MAG: hypothetical protein RMI94_01950 [Bryobacterales bacterium]|nr:hypothetical protein [Bryobacteraceae bacterium]MDW8129282.1 hypothetical protein [Bryobacterales bacterium]
MSSKGDAGRMSGVPRKYRAVACAGILALLALSVLYVVPHSWHKEDGARSCVVCVAYRTPAAPAATPLAIEPPKKQLSRLPVAAQRHEPLLFGRCFEPRAPPFPRAV